MTAAEGAAPPLLIHVGLHKTGTTWLQKNVFERNHGGAIEYFGDVGRIYDRLVSPAMRKFDPQAARDAFAPTLAAAAAAGRACVISGEALAGRPFHAKFYREIVAERIAATFPDARILLTVREQRAIIYSMYGQYVRFGWSASLPEFLDGGGRPGSQPILDMDFYDYGALLDEYELHFPKDRIVTIPFEWMIASPDAAVAHLAARSGIPLPPLAADDAARAANPAWSDLAYAVVRQVNRTISQDARQQRRKRLINPNSVGYHVNRFTPAGLRASMKARRMAFIDQALGDRYAASNAAFAARIGLDLAALGYRA